MTCYTIMLCLIYCLVCYDTHHTRELLMQLMYLYQVIRSEDPSWLFLIVTGYWAFVCIVPAAILLHQQSTVWKLCPSHVGKLRAFPSSAVSTQWTQIQTWSHPSKQVLQSVITTTSSQHHPRTLVLPRTSVQTHYYWCPTTVQRTEMRVPRSKPRLLD